jgi:hypothetical protein
VADQPGLREVANEVAAKLQAAIDSVGDAIVGDRSGKTEIVAAGLWRGCIAVWGGGECGGAVQAAEPPVSAAVAQGAGRRGDLYLHAAYRVDDGARDRCADADVEQLHWRKDIA